MKYSIKVNEVRAKEGSNIKGFATVVFGDSFKITNIAILENKDKEKSYYYWLRKFRKESYDQMQLPVTTENPAEISFVEIAAPVTSEKTIQTREFSSASNATAVVRNGDIILEISNDVSDAVLSRLLKEVVHAGERC